MKVDLVRLVNKMGTSDLGSFLGLLLWDDSLAISQNAVNMSNEDTLSFYDSIRTNLHVLPETLIAELTEATEEEYAKKIEGYRLVDDDSGYTIDLLEIDIGRVGDDIWHNIVSALRVCKGLKPLRIILSQDGGDQSEIPTEDL